MTPQPQEYRTRLDYLAAVVASHNSDECLLWPFLKDKDGYGIVGTINTKGQNRNARVHRLAFKLANGYWPEPMELHTCDTPACFNPRHIYAGTGKNNYDDQISRGRFSYKNGSKSCSAKISDLSVTQIRAEYAASGIAFKRLGKKYGISEKQTRNVVKGVQWAHIPGAVRATIKRPLQAVCKLGHALTPENTYAYTGKDGIHRRCKRCAHDAYVFKKKLMGGNVTRTGYQDTPVYIIARDRLDLGLRQLLAWLRRAGMTQITIIDNDSSYPPLLDFYNSSALKDINLIRRTDNLGHEVFWKLDYHLQQSGRYILSDCDVVPDDDCPLDLVQKMHEVADRYAPAKVGPAIRIDNIPAHYAQREHMRFCESDYWLRKYPEGDCWDAAIDTTLALYSPGWTRWPQAETGGVRHIRLDFPYVVNHVPWFEDSANPSEEAKYYRAHVAPGFSSSCMVPETA